MSLLRCGTTHLAGLSCFPLESPFPRYAPAAAISQDLVFPSLRGLASAVYFLIISLGALAPLFVGALNGWFDMKAPYQDEEEPQDVLDPTFSLLAVVGGSYLFSVFGFGLTSLLMISHKSKMNAMAVMVGVGC